MEHVRLTHRPYYSNKVLAKHAVQRCSNQMKCRACYTCFYVCSNGSDMQHTPASIPCFCEPCRNPQVSFATRVRVLFTFGLPWAGYPWGQQPAAYVAAFRMVAAIIHNNTCAAQMLWAPNNGYGYPWPFYSCFPPVPYSSLHVGRTLPQKHECQYAHSREKNPLRLKPDIFPMLAAALHTTRPHPNRG